MAIQAPMQTTVKKIYCGMFNRTIDLETYQIDDGSNIILHNSLKNFITGTMLRRAKGKKPPIVYEYKTISIDPTHCICQCTFTMMDYRVTETGEASARTLNSPIAKDYPYIEAEKRAFDRAAITFFQLMVDGKRVYSDAEVGR